jgi:hypothetical protein
VNLIKFIKIREKSMNFYYRKIDLYTPSSVLSAVPRCATTDRIAFITSASNDHIYICLAEGKQAMIEATEPTLTLYLTVRTWSVVCIDKYQGVVVYSASSKNMVKVSVVSV